MKYCAISYFNIFSILTEKEDQRCFLYSLCAHFESGKFDCPNDYRNYLTFIEKNFNLNDVEFPMKVCEISNL